MKIYEIREKINIRNRAEIIYFNSQFSIYQKESIHAAFGPRENETVVDYMINKRPLISGEMRNILTMYDPKLYTKRLLLSFYGVPELNKAYWFMQPKYLFALHEEVRDPRMNKENLVLKKEVVRYARIFSVIGLPYNRWFVNLEVVESLLRYNMLGFTLREVQVE